MPSTILSKINKQREILKGFLHDNMHELAKKCTPIMSNNQALDALLSDNVSRSSLCKYLWVVSPSAIQLTATVAREHKKEDQRGRDRAARPYMQRAFKGDEFYLSESYISRNRKRPSLTSVQAIKDENGFLLGFLGADFDLRELPHTAEVDFTKQGWQQMKGDPAIRGGLFAQQRVISAMDEKIDDVLLLINELFAIHGVFHVKLHFSSSRATMWLVDNPFDYQILGIDELTNASLCLAFPKRDYFEKATVPAEKIDEVFQQFKKLRFADETIYLRAASLNIVNGKVGLNFSCDGSHYVQYDEFLQKDNSFWFGVD